MLHELLFALAGHPSDVFRLASSGSESPLDDFRTPSKEALSVDARFRVVDDFDGFVHPSERTAVENLATLGIFYVEIKFFVETASNEFWSARLALGPGSNPPVGAYLLSFANALDVQLEAYRADIISTERKISSAHDNDTFGPETSLSYINGVFGRYFVLLPLFVSLIRTVSSSPSDYHGTKLLNFLYKHTKTGTEEVREAMETIFKTVNSVFYNQLSTWVIWGELEDPGLEFFVQLKEHDEAGSGHDEDEREVPWVPQINCTLAPDFIPTFLPHTLASTVLFIGQAVNTLRTQTKSTDLNQPLQVELESFLFNHSTLPTTLSLEIAITDLRKVVTKHLWNLMIVKENLVGLCTTFRNVFLMGRGEFWVDFVDAVEEIKGRVSLRRTSLSEFDLNNLLRKLKRKHGLDACDFLAGFEFTAYPDVVTTLPPYASHLAALYLQPTITFPLDLVFTPFDIQSYNSVFSFLFFIRRVKSRLDMISTRIVRGERALRTARLKDSKVKKKVQDPLLDGVGLGLNRRVWAMRNSIAGFVSCVYMYIQMDVIDSAYNHLVHDLTTPPNDTDADTAPTLDTLIRLHTRFLTTCVRGCFLDPKLFGLIGKHVQKALETAESFAGIVEAVVRERVEGGVVGAYSETQVHDPDAEDPLAGAYVVYNTFTTTTSFLFETFSSIKGSELGGTHSSHMGALSNFNLATCLSQFMLRWDFNRWVSCGSGS